MEEISILIVRFQALICIKCWRQVGKKKMTIISFIFFVSRSTSGWDLFFSSGHQGQVLPDTSLWAHNRASCCGFILGSVQVSHTGCSPAKTLVQMNWYTLENAGIELAAAQPSASWENVTWPANVWFTSLELNKTTAITDSKLLQANSLECHTLNVSTTWQVLWEITTVSMTALTLSQSETPSACQSLCTLIPDPFPLFFCSISCHSLLFLSNKKSEVQQYS